MKKFEIVKVSGVAMGVGLIEDRPEGQYSETICNTLFDTGNDIEDAKQSELWARNICKALNQLYRRHNHEKGKH